MTTLTAEDFVAARKRCMDSGIDFDRALESFRQRDNLDGFVNCYCLTEKLQRRAIEIKERLGSEPDDKDMNVYVQLRSYHYFICMIWNPTYEGSQYVHFQPQSPQVDFVWCMFKYAKLGVPVEEVRARLERVEARGLIKHTVTEQGTDRYLYILTKEEEAACDKALQHKDEKEAQRRAKVAERVRLKNEMAMLRQRRG
jgi:hypothetical protein